MSMLEGENIRFIRYLNIDPQYPYNYELVFLNALKVKFPKEFGEAKTIENFYSNFLSNSVIETYEFYWDPTLFQELLEIQSKWRNALGIAE